MQHHPEAEAGRATRKLSAADRADEPTLTRGQPALRAHMPLPVPRPHDKMSGRSAKRPPPQSFSLSAGLRSKLSTKCQAKIRRVKGNAFNGVYLGMSGCGFECALWHPDGSSSQSALSRSPQNIPHGPPGPRSLNPQPATLLSTHPPAPFGLSTATGL